MYVHVRICCYSALIQLVAAATIRERRLFRSALAQVRLLFESGVYSRAASIRSYTVLDIYAGYAHNPESSTSAYRCLTALWPVFVYNIYIMYTKNLQ